MRTMMLYIRAIIYIYNYIYVCVCLCAHACGKWSAWVCSFREFTPGCYRPSAEQNDRNCFLLAQIQQSQLEDQSNGALRRPLIGHRTAPKSLWWNSCRNWTALRLCCSLRILTWQLRSEASNPELDQVHVQLLQVDKVLFHSVGWVISGYSSKRNIGWWHIGSSLGFEAQFGLALLKSALVNGESSALPGPSQGNGQGSPNGSINGSLECRSVLTFLLNC